MSGGGAGGHEVPPGRPRDRGGGQRGKRSTAPSPGSWGVCRCGPNAPAMKSFRGFGLLDGGLGEPASLCVF